MTHYKCLPAGRTRCHSDTRCSDTSSSRYYRLRPPYSSRPARPHDLHRANHVTHSHTYAQTQAQSKKMVNGSRFYRALESVSIASALSSAHTIYPRQIRVHQTLTVLNSNFLQLGRRSDGQPRHSGQFTPGGYLSTVKHTTLAGIEPTTFRLLVRCATSSASETSMLYMPIGLPGADPWGGEGGDRPP